MLIEFEKHLIFFICQHLDVKSLCNFELISKKFYLSLNEIWILRLKLDFPYYDKQINLMTAKETYHICMTLKKEDLIFRLKRLKNFGLDSKIEPNPSLDSLQKEFDQCVNLYHERILKDQVNLILLKLVKKCVTNEYVETKTIDPPSIEDWNIEQIKNIFIKYLTLLINSNHQSENFQKILNQIIQYDHSDDLNIKNLHRALTL